MSVIIGIRVFKVYSVAANEFIYQGTYSAIMSLAMDLWNAHISSHSRMMVEGGGAKP